jgi:hypothetical protein
MVRGGADLHFICSGLRADAAAADDDDDDALYWDGGVHVQGISPSGCPSIGTVPSGTESDASSRSRTSQVASQGSIHVSDDDEMAGKQQVPFVTVRESQPTRRVSRWCANAADG